VVVETDLRGGYGAVQKLEGHAPVGGEEAIMFPLIDCSPQQLFTLASESGFSDKFGQLVTPLTNYRVTPDEKIPVAIDNGGFSRQDPKAFRRLLEKCRTHWKRILWCSVPDVVGDARRTLEVFEHWVAEIGSFGFPIALVAQDGIENLEIPWDMLDAVFVGGTTEWKMSESAKGVIRAAKWLDKRVHVGRINTGGRWEEFAKMGVDTFDGSALARPYPGARQQRANILLARQNLLSPAQNADITGSEAESVKTAEPKSGLPFGGENDYLS
jgi:hypothetical protein